MAELSSTADLYDALAIRDRTLAGSVYVGVTSTGIFCAFGCPARTPNLENCRFFETVADCLDAGFRACKRCGPAG